jgi:hypothetical protein
MDGGRRDGFLLSGGVIGEGWSSCHALGVLGGSMFVCGGDEE